MVMGSDIPKTEGQSIMYSCPPGFILTGPSASVCTGNGEWEPDPGQVDCIGDCDHDDTIIIYTVILALKLLFMEFLAWVIIIEF